MSRLIDAERFKRFLQALCKAGAPYDDVIQLLDKEPTAYDIDAVVAELENFKINGTNLDKADYNWNLALIEAIETVKKGGVE